jgi:hypothetical protein
MLAEGRLSTSIQVGEAHFLQVVALGWYGLGELHWLWNCRKEEIFVLRVALPPVLVLRAVFKLE